MNSSTAASGGGSLPCPPRLAIDFSPARFFLIIGPSNIRYILTRLAAGLAENDPVRVIEAGNPLEPSLLRQLTRGHPEAVNRIHVRRAVSCRRLLSLLEDEPASPLPLLLLDLLGPFYTGSVHLSVRREILAACLDQLQRLRTAAGGAVSLSPPPFPLRSARGLFQQVLAASPSLFSAQLTFPGKSLRKLY